MPKKQKPKAKRVVKSAKPKRERRDFAQIAFEAVQMVTDGGKAKHNNR
jgi:hypothetical protein